MRTVTDFEDLLMFLEQNQVRYLIVGGMAFIFHARPRLTKDMDLWIDPRRSNVRATNRALAEFGSPILLAEDDRTQIVQIGIAPNRIDLLLALNGFRFAVAWKKRIRATYGEVETNWIDLDTLIKIKSRIDHPRHQDDARILREVKKRLNRRESLPHR